MGAKSLFIVIGAPASVAQSAPYRHFADREEPLEVAAITAALLAAAEAAGEAGA